MIFVSGTISSTVQLQTLTNKWNQKKDSGNVLSKQELNERDSWTQQDWMKHHFEEQLETSREAGKKTELDNKMMSGGTLTPEEERYLEQEDPAALQKYRQMKAEKKAYEEKLRECETKDEVERLKTETMGHYLASMKKIENNPYIPMSEKLAKAQELIAKTKNIHEVEMKFMQSAQYAKLPTEAKEAKERARDRETENDKILTELEEKDSEETENVMEEFIVDDERENDKKKMKNSIIDPEMEIEESYKRIKFNVDLEMDAQNVQAAGEKSSGDKIDFYV